MAIFYKNKYMQRYLSSTRNSKKELIGERRLMKKKKRLEIAVGNLICLLKWSTM